MANLLTKLSQKGIVHSHLSKMERRSSLWHKGKVKQLLQGAGLQQLSEKEMHCKEMARVIMEVERLDNKGEDKAAYLLYDSIRSEIKRDNIPIINRFLQEMGSKQQLGEDDE